MGTWGPGPFENDEAGDWLASVNALTDHDLRRREIAAALAGPRARTASAASAQIAVAAAAYIAQSPPSPADGMQLTAEELRVHARDAVGAIASVRRHSELNDLWDEQGAGEWLASLAGITQTLLAIVGDRPRRNGADRAPR